MQCINKHQKKFLKSEIASCFCSPGDSNNLQLHVLAGDQILSHWIPQR